jgi:O-antigen ligase
VFPHKNVFGPVMAVAMFVELYVTVTDMKRRKRRLALVAMYAALVILSRSLTGLLLAAFYLAGAGLYVLWRRHRLGAALLLIGGFHILLAGVVVLWSDPSSALGAIGKDVTLTGRTTLWGVVITYIRERPALGWGYNAMWVLGDPTTTFLDAVIGQWGAVKSSQNAFLEVTLELGLVGISVMLMILGAALWRGLRCCRAGIVPLGWFSLVFVVGVILAGLTEQTLGQNQTITWTVFNILLFGCGLELAKLRQPKTTIQEI